jgi:hypothetical protein
MNDAPKPIVLNASTVYCPDLFLVIRRFINENKANRYVQINTQELRAESRIKELCINYGYQYKTKIVGKEHYFLLDLAPEEITA